MMNWLFIALTAQIILGFSAVFDRMLLQRGYFNPWAYTFWLGMLGLPALFLFPFGSLKISFSIFWVAMASGVLFGIGLLLLYFALKRTEASISLPVIAGFSSLFALIFSIQLLHSQINPADTVGFVLLVFGGLILFWIEEKNIRYEMMALTVISALALGLSQVLAKIVFNETSFIGGFIWIKISGALFALMALFIPAFRKKIAIKSSLHLPIESGLYIANRLLAGIGSLFFSAAIFLAHPAVVEATQGFQYVIIFIFGWLLLHERFYGKILWAKIFAVILIGAGIAWFAFAQLKTTILPVNPSRSIAWGVTFSDKFSRDLDLDPKDNFRAIINDLKVDRMRLIAYWDSIGKERNSFDFSDLDWQIGEAQKRNIKIILTIGMKVPRWPECHLPDWAKTLSKEEREKELLMYLAKVIKRYKNSETITTWQIENEPFFSFGECPERGKDFLSNEISLLRSIDKSRPVLVTDSGELGLWLKSAKAGDIFGTTMYRRVYNKYFGRVNYHLPPQFFIFKEKATRFLINDYSKKFIVIELAAEPWMPKQIYETSPEEQFKYFDFDFFKNTVKYAKSTGFSEYYFWGAEWWYYLKVRGHPEIWEEAQKLWR
mgnify:FL=1